MKFKYIKKKDVFTTSGTCSLKKILFKGVKGVLIPTLIFSLFLFSVMNTNLLDVSYLFLIVYFAINNVSSYWAGRHDAFVEIENEIETLFRKESKEKEV